MILMRENPFIGRLEEWKGWPLKIETILDPEMATSEASVILAQKESKHHITIQAKQRCGTVTIFYGSGSGPDF
jgi:hypothetical protein